MDESALKALYKVRTILANFVDFRAYYWHFSLVPSPNAHCQRPSNVKNDVTCGGIPQQWMKAR